MSPILSFLILLLVYLRLTVVAKGELGLSLDEVGSPSL